jgi:hypothetical protein
MPDTENIMPFEVKKIIIPNLNTLPRLGGVESINSSIRVLKINQAENSITIENQSPAPLSLTNGLPFACGDSGGNLPASEIPDGDELEALLEPTDASPLLIDKEEELNFVKKHQNIPDDLKADFLKFLDTVPELYSGSDFSRISFPPSIYQHDVELIDPTVSELRQRPYAAVGIREQQLKECINDLVLNGVLEPGDSSFTSPVFFVTKKTADGATGQKGRLCYDYRGINRLIKSKNHPLASTKHFFNNLQQYNVFSLIDVKNAFLSIPLTEEAKKYLAITTPFGIYLPTRTPFGLKSSPSAFNFAMSKVLGDLPFCNVYMDDICIGGVNNEEMIKHLKIVMSRLHKFNLKIQLSKTKFFVTEFKCLGVIYSKHGKKIDPEKIAAIEKIPLPTSLKTLQSFLGTVAFLCSASPHYSTCAYPLFQLLQNKEKFQMTEEGKKSFLSLKSFLSQDTQLYHPDFDKPFYINCDASVVGIGSFLYQLDVYEKTEEGKRLMLEKLGFEPEQGKTAMLLPGVSPGKKAPVVSTFAHDDKQAEKYDI